MCIIILTMDKTDSNNETDGHLHFLGNARSVEWKLLRMTCESFGIEDCYKLYTDRLLITSNSLLMFVVFILFTLYVLLLLIFAKFIYLVALDISMQLCSLILMLLILTSNYNSLYLHSQLKMRNFICSFAIFLMVFKDILVVQLHSVKGVEINNYAFDHVTITSIFLFLPVNGYLSPLILGFLSALTYLSHVTYLTVQTNNLVPVFKLLTMVAFYTSLIIMGLVFRALREYAIRITLLNRRQLVKEHLLLKIVVDRETTVIKSILPPQITQSMENDVKNRIEQNQLILTNQSVTRALFIEQHTNVSILNADMVNFSNLSNRLNVNNLVEILHEIFVKFDRAAEKHNVLRIKFLGNNYQCASGIPLPNVMHAKCCVNLGLDMITKTREISDKHHLNIDMRVGVHSGDVFSGVIGLVKWQFDIWSKDVEITACLEATGRPGYVHVSSQTLHLLDEEYIYEPGTQAATVVPILMRYSLSTYLIYKKKKNMTLNYETDCIELDAIRSSTTSIEQQIEYFDSQNDIDSEIHTMANAQMIYEIENMPIGTMQVARIFDFSTKRETGKCEDYVFETSITPFWLIFRNSKTEWSFMHEPDLMLKYSSLTSIVISIIMSLFQISHSDVIYFLIGILLMSLMCFVIFYKKIRLICSCKSTWDQPHIWISKVLYQLNVIIHEKLFARIIYYIFFIGMAATLTSLSMIQCNTEEYELEMIEAQLLDIIPVPAGFYPWGATYSIVSVLHLCFLYPSTPLVIKTGVSCIIIFTYFLLVFFNFNFVFERSASTCVDFRPKLAHFWYIFAMFTLLYVRERQNVYMAKVNYRSKMRIQEKHKRIEMITRAIEVIICNTLPSHVADKFLENSILRQLFTENFEKVAILFATIQNYDYDKISLRVLNEIICRFDELLYRYTGPYKVEKIKFANWTYLAVCGLQKHQKLTKLTDNDRFALDDVDGKTYVKFQPTKIESYILEDDNVVFVLTHFALEMLRIMHNVCKIDAFSESFFEKSGELTIGISHGPIMAGVVGQSKPHYDIWGNSVNMAAHMDHTGINGKIQVGESTAKILRGFDIKCDYRGMVFVKGIGELPAYTVGVNRDFEFMHDDRTSHKYNLGNLKANLWGSKSKHGSKTSL